MSVIAACLPLLPALSHLLVVKLQAVRWVVVDIIRAIDSIDRLQTQDEGISMRSLVPSQPEDDWAGVDIPAIYVQSGFSVGREVASR